MTILRKVKCCTKPVVDFGSYLESVKSIKKFSPKNIKVTIAQTINKSV